MLRLDKNRVDYGALLHVPNGFELEYAVGTTYSLDLHTLLMVPIALFNHQFLDLEETSEPNPPIQIIDALKKAKKKLKIFCQLGNIHIPRSYHSAYTLLESCVQQIAPPTERSSFHPKCWLLRFRNVKTNQILYRFVNATRNITFDQSWDIAYVTEGYVNKELMPRNEELSKFMDELFLGVEEVPTSFLEDISRVDFIPAEGFNEQRILPYGLKKSSLTDEDGFVHFIRSNRFEEALVISPFWTADVLKTLLSSTDSTLHIIGRKVEFDKLPSQLFDKCRSYVVNPSIRDLAQTEDVEAVISNEETIKSSASNPRFTDHHELHAKAYFFKINEDNHWWLGSTNASYSGLHLNCESLVHLISKENNFSPQTILSELIDEEKEQPFFVDYIPDSQEEAESPEEMDYREIVQKICSLFTSTSNNIMVTCEQAGRDEFNLVLNVPEIQFSGQWDFEVQIKPSTVSESGWKKLEGEQQIRFSSLPEANLSQFFSVKIIPADIKLDEHQFVVLVDIENLPESRGKHIMSQLIQNTDRLFKYISYLLGEPQSVSLGNQSTVRSIRNGEAGSVVQRLGIPMAEKLLESASRDLKRLAEIDDLLSELHLEDEDKEFTTFLTFWEPFQEILNGYSDE